MDRKRRLLERACEILDIPPSYYKKAVERYEALGEWFEQPESSIALFHPKVYAQGSFRLGTVIRPLFTSEEYDLDIVCELRELEKNRVTQKQVKHLVGNEVKSYAKAKGIKAPVAESKRCWRLDYADEVSFHIDTLPCIPEDRGTIGVLVRLGVDPALAEFAIAITCLEDEGYDEITQNWPKSNAAGFAKWFEEHMSSPATNQRRQLVARGIYESVEHVPAYELKTPLQRSVQLLKRHRDVMFRDEPELKPISMIITTLSTHAYKGEMDLGDALGGILERLPSHVRPNTPRVPNPVNPGEDFANKWASDPRLEDNFWLWHAQARRDFDVLRDSREVRGTQQLLEKSLSLSVGEEEVRDILGAATPVVAVAPEIRVSKGPKPWRRGGR